MENSKQVKELEKNVDNLCKLAKKYKILENNVDNLSKLTEEYKVLEKKFKKLEMEIVTEVNIILKGLEK